MRKLTEQDLAAIIGTTQAGYTIQKARVKGGEFIDSDHYGIALGHCSHTGLNVTWQWHLDEKERPDFYWGHYIECPKKALLDYETRE